MKSFLMTLIATFSALSSPSVLAQANPSQPSVRPTAFGTAYIPGGFDSNDQVEVVGEGVFPNTCYRPIATPRVKIDETARRIQIAPESMYYDGICLQMLVRFDQTVALGVLPAGTYQIVQEGRGASDESRLGFLRVGIARSSDADDFLYAPVAQAYAERKAGQTTIRVAGAFTNSCMKLVDVNVSVEPNVLVVQPIAEREERPDCTEGNFPYDQTVNVANVASGRYLLHVRSLNGKAFNHLVDLY